MIFIFTGVNGSAKTLNTIRYINEDDLFKGRPVFYFHIHELKLPWTELNAEQVRDWKNQLPTGSVLVVDECHKVFPTRSAKNAVPDFIRDFDEHRSMGLDVIFISQNPMKIDVELRRLCGRHFHLERPFGMAYTRALEWNRCVNDPQNYHDRQEAVSHKWLFRKNKKYFDQYKSAEIHTHKAKIPLKLWLILIPVLFLVYAGYHLFTRFWSDPEPVDRGTETAPSYIEPSRSQQPVRVPREERVLSRKEWVESRVPRVSGFPESASMYDEVQEVVSAPRVAACIQSDETGDCRCYTQQATLYNTTTAICKAIIEHSRFNPLRPDIAMQRYNHSSDRE